MAHVQLLPHKYPAQGWGMKEQHPDSVKESKRKIIWFTTVCYQCRRKQYYPKTQEQGVKTMNPQPLIPPGIMWEDKYDLDQV